MSPSAAEALVAVVTTVATREDAQRLARTLVERRLVACAQVEAIDSTYRWQDRLHTEPEFRLLLKTLASRTAAVEAALRELHPYELPAIYTLAVPSASAGYAAWVAEAVAEAPGAGG